MNNAEIIKKEGLIVILRGIPIQKIEKIVKSLYDGGVRIIEIAFNPSDKNTIHKTTDLINTVRKTVGNHMMIGAGTVLDTDYVIAAHRAGADFIFSPDADIDIIRLTKNLGLVSIPGALTPSEVKTAYKYGADIIKLFPVTVNMINYIKNITRPLSHIPFICVGGVNENTIGDFIKVGAKGVATGISILKPELIENEDYEEIQRLAALHISQIIAAKNNA